MSTLPSDSPAVRAYFETLQAYETVGAAHEQAVKTAFHDVLQAAAKLGGWTLVPEFTPPGRRTRYDGALRDAFGFTLGYWEAKDEDDDLDTEIQRKIERGYRLQNTVFQAPSRAVLYQDGRVVLDTPLDTTARLALLLDTFLAYREPELDRFHEAVAEFKAKIPDLAQGLVQKVHDARVADPAFRTAFDGLVETARQAINPNLRAGAVEEMLVQHLLTERLIASVFNNSDFRARNAIAAEIERVVQALTARHFSRKDFLGQLDRYYRAIEDAASGITDFAEKQALLNTVYEQFFQGFSAAAADVYGIVYTPQPLVDFMVRSIDRLLERHFGQSLAAPGVHVLDPFTGTGNFLVRVLEAIPTPNLPDKYRDELHANEVMLLPYYVASLNLEHAYFERTGRYEPFSGIVLTDTFDMVEGRVLGMFSAENSVRAERQRNSPIKVILGNPPYNAHQANANDANQNRRYPIVDRRVSETYARESQAQNKNSLGDPYVKAFRWASDRLGNEGVVAFVTNGSFVDDRSFDGMRKMLGAEFDEVYVLDLGGNVRKNPKLSGTTHNVFGIQVGVAVTFLVRHRGKGLRPAARHATIRYAATPADWKKEQKYDYLAAAGDLDGIDWTTLAPNARYDWLTEGQTAEWDTYLPLGSTDEKASEGKNETTIFDQFSRGVETGRDAWVYDFDRDALEDRVERMMDTYNAQVSRWKRKGGKGVRPEDVVTYDETKIKWTSSLVSSLKAGVEGDVRADAFRRSLYRPFVPKWLYYDPLFIHRTGHFSSYFPTPETENLVMWIKVGSDWPMFALMVDRPPDLLPQGGSQAFPLYVYRADGTREDNITDWALDRFRARYAHEHAARALTKRDVFHYAYAVLHAPDYRARHAADLRRSLPRLPFAPAFWPLADAGAELATLHVGFTTAPEYPLGLLHTPGQPLDAPTTALAWADKDKSGLRLSDALTLTGIPPEAHAYRLGTRSALDWLVDQMKDKHDTRSGITHRLSAAQTAEQVGTHVRRVTHISVETARIVAALPPVVSTGR
ncbi:MAG: N-6 DNA methylase [Rhodothermales bacterium]|nr:N-6 DNA methylase [Rhodothermales bacterium]